MNNKAEGQWPIRTLHNTIMPIITNNNTHLTLHSLAVVVKWNSYYVLVHTCRRSHLYCVFPPQEAVRSSHLWHGGGKTSPGTSTVPCQCEEVPRLVVKVARKIPFLFQLPVRKILSLVCFCLQVRFLFMYILVMLSKLLDRFVGAGCYVVSYFYVVL